MVGIESKKAEGGFRGSGGGVIPVGIILTGPELSHPLFRPNLPF